MIEILGSKVSFFTLYGLISLQVMAIACAVAAIKVGTKTVDDFPLAVPTWFGFVISEIILLAWMGSL